MESTNGVLFKASVKSKIIEFKALKIYKNI
jgi:hypothetical protein